ncbi:MAG: DNA cytosine methyltransferase [Clostridia bacterium]|nr:DNA cytosine methyltransferase [Clostridia bacterium]
MIKTVGSVCSGIEAASVAWNPLGLSFEWFSEIAAFPSRVLKEKFPDIPNLGDMNNIPALIEQGKITAPDLICGGTPCQAFSLAGGKNGLNDERGNLTLKFVDIIEANDKERSAQGKQPCIVFWENVEGVLKDKTNAFGCLISSLAGLDNILTAKSWPSSGLLEGKKRNVAWRVLDAKYFGLPQQRKRLYVIAGGKDFHPETVLFELHRKDFVDYPSAKLTFQKDGHDFEVFREYSDCLYSAYGTKWNGNAAAYNGSLFVVQDGRLRRLSPLECERLMGFPDHYTDLAGASRTNRYQAIGNSWAVPVVRWIGARLVASCNDSICFSEHLSELKPYTQVISEMERFYDLGKDIIPLSDRFLNCTEIPETCVFCTLPEIVSADAPAAIYISPVGCSGIVRRKNERNASINPRLEEIMNDIASQMPMDEIERKSRIQQRGRFSQELGAAKIAI